MNLLVAIVLISGLLSSPGPASRLSPGIMADLNKTQERDPTGPASTADIVQLMFKFIAKQLEAERKLTKELIDAKIRKVIECLNVKIETVTEVIKRYNPILSDLDLKIETTTSYNEQLIYSLKSGLQDALSNIEADVKSVSSELQYCQNRSATFDNSSTLEAHKQSLHEPATSQADIDYHSQINNTIPSLCACKLCGLTFFSPASFQLHIVSFHAQQLHVPSHPHRLLVNNYSDQMGTFHSIPSVMSSQNSVSKSDLNPSCLKCGEVFYAYSDLSSHITPNHGGCDTQCDPCETALLSNNDLNLHVQSEHRAIFGSIPNLLPKRCVVCPDCDQSFSQPTELSTHITSVHGKYHNPCNHCETTGQTNSDFNYHTPIHKGSQTITPSLERQDSGSNSPILQVDVLDVVVPISPIQMALMMLYPTAPEHRLMALLEVLVLLIISGELHIT